MNENKIGTIKNKRLDPDLLDSPFQIDQHSLWDILEFISSFLEKINFYDLENNKLGSWKSLVESDPIIFMSVIINEPLTDLNILLQKNQIKVIGKNDESKIIETLITWYDKVENWGVTLNQLGEGQLSHKIQNILSDVLEELRQKLLMYKTASLKGKEKNDKQQDELLLTKILHTFRKVILHIQQFTKKYLEENLYLSNKHAPNNAMYIAFALLYKHIQNNINQLSQKHLDFYYKTLLQQEKRKGSGTSTVVSFDLLPNISNSLIPEGTLLSAGKLLDSKSDVLFQTVKPLVAYQIELMEMQTLFFNSNPYISVGTDNPLISSISKNNLISKGKPLSNPGNWFSFGANPEALQSVQLNPNNIAEMGFIISSPVLKLSEGERTIKIDFNLEKNSAKKVLWKLIDEMQINRNSSTEIIFKEIFEEGFVISFSSLKGWVEFQEYTVVFNESQNYFSIVLHLNSSDPEVELGKIEEQLSFPALKIKLNEYAPTYLYSFFKGVLLNTIIISVDVKRVKNLSLYNNISKVPTGKTFDAFGPVPQVGSYLLIGKSEIFQKQIDVLNLNIEWESVPNEYGGFTTYYENYDETITNDSFTVQFSAMSNGYWIPLNKSQEPEINLFETKNVLTPEGYPSVQLSTLSTLTFNSFNQLSIDSDFSLKDPLKYTVTSQSGFIRLTLTAPQFGFGQDLYQKEFTEIATFNAHNNNYKIPLPNKPFVPKIKAISIDYSASDTLIFEEEFSKTSVPDENTGEFFHITPFGIEPVIDDQSIKKRSLLVDFEAQGYLFLGLKGITETTTVSIYFHFSRSDAAIDVKEDQLNWEYYNVNEWIPFDHDNILRDETRGFIKSGIIEMILPEVNFSEVFPDNFYWIRISTNKNVQYYPVIKGIYFNAVKAVCISEDPEVIGKNISAGSITKASVKLPDIKSILQPSESRNGRVMDSEQGFYLRTSERLRHKERAVSSWDYERLIIDRFNDVWIAKCVKTKSPGHIKVVVMSSRWISEGKYFFDSDTLEDMKSYLQKFASPFVQIDVINPEVDYLQVNTIVEFKPEDNGGYYMDLLNKEISEFLSPAGKTDNGIGGIGGSLVPTMVFSFIENLDYIKKVKSLSVEQIVKDGFNQFRLKVYTGAEEIKAQNPWSVLYPVENHHIVPVISVLSDNESIKVGIENLEIGADFIIGSESKAPKPSIETVPMENLNLPDNALLIFKDKSQNEG